MSCHNIVIPVHTHVLEQAEEDIDNTQLLLSAFASRARKLANSMDTCEPEYKDALFSEAVDILYEFYNSLYFVQSRLDERSSSLHSCLVEEVAKVLSRLPPGSNTTEMKLAA